MERKHVLNIKGTARQEKVKVNDSPNYNCQCQTIPGTFPSYFSYFKDTNVKVCVKEKFD